MSAKITPWPDEHRPAEYRVSTVTFDEMRRVKPDENEVELVREMGDAIDRMVSALLDSLPDDAIVHPGLTAVTLDHNHLMWRSGTVVERIYDRTLSQERPETYLRVARGVYVEGVRMDRREPYGEGDEIRLVPLG